jgi:hypothetical protein
MSQYILFFADGAKSEEIIERGRKYGMHLSEHDAPVKGNDKLLNGLTIQATTQ